MQILYFILGILFMIGGPAIGIWMLIEIINDFSWLQLIILLVVPTVLVNIGSKFWKKAKL